MVFHSNTKRYTDRADHTIVFSNLLAAEANSDAMVDQPITAKGQKGQHTILVVSEANVRELMALHLRKAGYRVFTALNGPEGYEVAQAEGPDMIISDVAVQVNNVELCRLIRAHAHLRTTPVILVNAAPEHSEIIVEALKTYADDFLELPYDPMMLIRKVAELIERRYVEQSLRASELEMRALFAAMTDVVFVLSAGGRYLKIAPTKPSFLYKPAAHLIGKTLHQVFPKEQADFFFSNVRRALSEGRRHNVEYLLEIEGKEVWFDGSVSPMSDDSVLWVARDITERKRTEEALRDAEKNYRSIFENAVEGIFQSTPEGRLISANPALARMLGYKSPQDLIESVTEIEQQLYVEPDRRAEFVKLLQEDGVGRGFVAQLRRKDGSLIWALGNARVVRDASGQLVCYEGSVEDITERKQLEEQLRQSQKMEAVGQLAGGIAHDFNNLLTAINGYSDLTLKNLTEDSPLRSKVEQIKKAGVRAASLTRQLLAFSRKQVLQPVVLDINSLVTDVSKMLRRLVGEDIEFVTLLRPKTGNVNADPGQIEQVLMNLVVNARDAMPKGGKIVIETANAEFDEGYAEQHVAVNPGPYVMLAVSDTGTGMDEETRARIFEPFFTTKELGKGTGLGLSTVYGIVKQSGGFIWAYSELGKGTTFKVYLPCIAQLAEGYKRNVEPKSARRGTETILLVEDDKTVRDLVREVLRDYGYKVLVAVNGEDALSVAERHEAAIHLLLTDVVMPGMGGRILANRLSEARPEMKMLFMSGYTDDAIVHHGVLDADTPFIQKPFPPHVLAQRVRDVLDGQPTSQGDVRR
ncbi:MAG TPA: response regulator [Pyrinomonadaceae bacterium]|nr:response regulator [Pyrinomonadaceae bacterium]